MNRLYGVCKSVVSCPGGALQGAASATNEFSAFYLKA